MSQNHLDPAMDNNKTALEVIHTTMKCYFELDGLLKKMMLSICPIGRMLAIASDFDQSICFSEKQKLFHTKFEYPLTLRSMICQLFDETHIIYQSAHARMRLNDINLQAALDDLSKSVAVLTEHERYLDENEQTQIDIDEKQHRSIIGKVIDYHRKIKDSCEQTELLVNAFRMLRKHQEHVMGALNDQKIMILRYGAKDTGSNNKYRESSSSDFDCLEKLQKRKNSMEKEIECEIEIWNELNLRLASITYLRIWSESPADALETLSAHSMVSMQRIYRYMNADSAEKMQTHTENSLLTQRHFKLLSKLYAHVGLAIDLKNCKILVNYIVKYLKKEVKCLERCGVEITNVDHPLHFYVEGKEIAREFLEILDIKQQQCDNATEAVNPISDEVLKHHSLTDKLEVLHRKATFSAEVFCKEKFGNPRDSVHDGRMVSSEDVVENFWKEIILVHKQEIRYRQTYLLELTKSKHCLLSELCTEEEKFLLASKQWLAFGDQQIFLLAKILSDFMNATKKAWSFFSIYNMQLNIKVRQNLLTRGIVKNLRSKAELMHYFQSAIEAGGVIQALKRPTELYVTISNAFIMPQLLLFEKQSLNVGTIDQREVDRLNREIVKEEWKVMTVLHEKMIKATNKSVKKIVQCFHVWQKDTVSFALHSANIATMRSLAYGEDE